MQQASFLNYPAVTHPSLTPCAKHPHKEMQFSSLTFPTSHLWIQTVSLLQIPNSKARGTRAIISSQNVQVKPHSCVRAYSWPRALCTPPHPPCNRSTSEEHAVGRRKDSPQPFQHPHTQWPHPGFNHQDLHRKERTKPQAERKSKRCKNKAKQRRAWRNVNS